MTVDLLENEIELVTELARRLRADTPLRILDIGCGSGKLSLYLHETTGYEVIGIDPGERSVTKAREKTSTLTFLVQSAEALTFPNSDFDCVVSLKAFHEIPHPHKALQEAHRVLRPGGRIFIIDWVGGAPQTSSHGHANRYFTPGRLHDALLAAGFADVTIMLNAAGMLMLAEAVKR